MCIIEISKIEIVKTGGLILFHFSGSHFFEEAGAPQGVVMVEAGRGKLNIGEIETISTRPSEIVAKLTAPPSGLYLEKVCSAGDKLPEELVQVIRVK